MRFHAYSPMIKDIKVLQRADAKKRQPGLTRTRRAKLYYLRGRTGKSARIAERRDNRPAKTEAAE